MDLLKKNNGYTILETLTSIALLGIIVILIIMLFNSFFENSKFLRRQEAFYYANQAIEQAITAAAATDTSYTVQNTIEIKRKVTNNNNLYKAEVTAVSIQNKTKIVQLNVYYAK